METGAKIKIDDLFAYGFVVAYKLPAMMGYGEHWELTKEESKQLGASLKACLETIPEERKKRVMRRVENVLPWVALFAYGGVMTYTRMKMTEMLAAKERHARVYNIDGTPREPARPVSVEDTNASGPPDKPVPRDGAKQPGHTYSGGKDIPLDFVIPD